MGINGNASRKFHYTPKIKVNLPGFETVTLIGYSSKSLKPTLLMLPSMTDIYLSVMLYKAI